jgi:hypothetical protein
LYKSQYQVVKFSRCIETVIIDYNRLFLGGLKINL